MPIFFPQAHFISLLVTLRSLHSSLIPHWQPFVFNQREMLKQRPIELSLHDTVCCVLATEDYGRGAKGNWHLASNIPLRYLQLDYDELRWWSSHKCWCCLFYCSTPHTACLRIASSLQNWFCHFWLKTKGQCSNKFLNSFHRGWIWYFLPCSLGITGGSP